MRSARQLRSLLRAPEALGHLVESGSPRVPIVKSSDAQQPETYSERNKYDELTLQGKSPVPGMTLLPEELSSEVSNMTRHWPPQLLRQKVAGLYGALGKGESHRPAFDSIDVEAHITGMFLQNFASVQSALLEVQKRRPEFAPNSILDVGFGPSTGLLAARSVFELSNETREVSAIIGHPRMKRRAKQLLKTTDNVVFKDSVPSPNSSTKYDLIITTHQLYQSGPLAEEIADSHSQQLAQQLAPGGIIVFIERGDPTGFEAVALAREHLLRPKYGFNTVGPCQHQSKCPLQLGLITRQFAKQPASQNWCRFSQNVQRPRFAIELKKGQYLAQEWLPESTRGRGGKNLKGAGRPHGSANEIANFSWVALQNGDASTEPSSEWPRILKQPMKRDGHVVMEVCAANGAIEHWTVPRSQGKQAYHDARKADEMDLWPLGAKTKQARGGLRNPANLKPQELTDKQKQKLAAESKDWWKDQNNPHSRPSGHQARVHAENTSSPEDEGFLSAMETLLAEDETRALKIERREVQSRYRS